MQIAFSVIFYIIYRNSQLKFNMLMQTLKRVSWYNFYVNMSKKMSKKCTWSFETLNAFFSIRLFGTYLVHARSSSIPMRTKQIFWTDHLEKQDNVQKTMRSLASASPLSRTNCTLMFTILYGMEKLRSKFRKDQSIKHVTILTVDARHRAPDTGRRTQVKVIL